MVDFLTNEKAVESAICLIMVIGAVAIGIVGMIKGRDW